MIFNDIVARAQHRLEKRSKYRRLVAEIQSLTDRDLADFNGNRSEMLHAARRAIYG